MDYTTSEKVIIGMLRSVADEYRALERNEGPGTNEDRSTFMQGIALASNVLEIRALRRDHK